MNKHLGKTPICLPDIAPNVCRDVIEAHLRYTPYPSIKPTRLSSIRSMPPRLTADHVA